MIAGTQCGGAPPRTECMRDTDCNPKSADAGSDAADGSSDASAHEAGADASTATARICDGGFAACAGASCRAPCTVDLDCAGHSGNGFGVMVCDASTGHCVEKVCAVDGDCRANFTCQPVGTNGSKTCRRKPCIADGECQGACVERQCSDTTGTCVTTIPAP